MPEKSLPEKSFIILLYLNFKRKHHLKNYYDLGIALHS